LSNETYVGTLIQGREKKTSYKSKAIQLTPKDEWIIIPNNHEPIIKKELFEEVQSLMKKRRKVDKKSSSTQPHIFSGIIKCADCGSTMVKTSGRSGGGFDYFICQLSRKTNNQKCSRHSIRYVDLQSLVKDKINCLLDPILKNHADDLLQQCYSNNDEKLLRTAKSKLHSLEAELVTLQNTLGSLYIDKANGILSETEFIHIKSSLNDKLNTQEAAVTWQKKALCKVQEEQYSSNSSAKLLRYFNLDEITFELLHSLISCINIGDTSDNSQNITIQWKF
jgi:hypothetical protein